MFTTPDHALLADFDSAGLKPIEGDSDAAQYMAPEQFKGMASKEGDQYALGCIAYELFTGQHPFNALDPFTLRFMHINEMPLLPRQLNPELPVHIEQAILTAMAKQPAERYPNVKAFIRALHVPPSQEDTSSPTMLRTISDVDTNLTVPAINSATLPAQTPSYNAWGYTSDVLAPAPTPTPVPGMMVAVGTATRQKPGRSGAGHCW